MQSFKNIYRLFWTLWFLCFGTIAMFMFVIAGLYHMKRDETIADFVRRTLRDDFKP